MIPNLLNTVLGIVLVYGAILAPDSLTAGVWAMIGSGAGIVLLALWARAGDRVKWFSMVNAILGVALILLGLAGKVAGIHPLVRWVFWAGIIVAVLALWSALYNRDTARTR